MTRPAQQILFVAVGLMAATALLLNRLKVAQRLGDPGVKVAAHALYDEHGALAATNAVLLPDRVLDFEGQDTPVTRLELDWLPKDTTHGRRLYRASSGFQVMLLAILMGTDRTSIHKPQQCITGQGFAIEKEEPLVVPVQKPHPYPLPVLRITATREVERPGGEKVRQRALYAYWFVADGELTASHWQRFWRMSRHLVSTGTLQRWAYIGCFAVCAPGQEEATWAQMSPFIAAAVPEFQTATLPPGSGISSGGPGH